MQCVSMHVVSARSTNVKRQGINLFVAPNIKADFLDHSGPSLHGDVLSHSTVREPPMHYTVAGRVVQWWKKSVAALFGGHQLPGTEASLHDPVTGSSVGKFGAAYTIAGPMGGGSYRTPGGH
ncbi:hypothetical protein D5366_01040 [Neokomagataea tanensis]|uniref:Uncharacterized protein n=2 Tax=Neokomagataea TaxID=1223423 RepID=A0A4Y6V634_9PROT|nr:hypothetical protein D5366_01040 [Neokomagataea tanensis]